MRRRHHNLFVRRLPKHDGGGGGVLFSLFESRGRGRGRERKSQATPTRKQGIFFKLASFAARRLARLFATTEKEKKEQVWGVREKKKFPLSLALSEKAHFQGERREQSLCSSLLSLSSLA